MRSNASPTPATLLIDLQAIIDSLETHQTNLKENEEIERVASNALQAFENARDALTQLGTDLREVLRQRKPKAKRAPVNPNSFDEIVRPASDLRKQEAAKKKLGI